MLVWYSVIFIGLWKILQYDSYDIWWSIRSYKILYELLEQIKSADRTDLSLIWSELRSENCYTTTLYDCFTWGDFQDWMQTSD